MKNDLTDNEMIQVRNPRLLNLTVYVIVLIMVSIAFISLPGGPAKITAIALCLAFGLVHAFGFRAANTLRRISVYFATQTIFVLVLMKISYPSDVFNLFFYILGVLAVVVLPSRAALAWILVFFLADSLSVLLSRGVIGVINALFYAAAFMLTAVFGYALRQAEIARQQNQQLLDELKASQRQLQELAVVEERNRLAREMHDSLGHRLTVSIVQLEGAQRLIPSDPQRAARMIGSMRDEMKEALAELRRTVAALRAPLAGEQPLPETLSNLSRTFQKDTGISTHFSVSEGFPAIPEAHRLAFFRAAQEALTNIQRHAEAHNGWVRLSADDRAITLVVEDDGKGLVERDSDPSGSGLIGLKERAAQFHGDLQLGERPGGGAQLTFSVPLPQGGIRL